MGAMVDLSSVLDAVTVYREGAVCVRRARVDAGEPGAGDARVRFVGLPLALTPNSLRARLHASAAPLRVLDVRASFEVQLGRDVDVAAEQAQLERAQDDA